MEKLIQEIMKEFECSREVAKEMAEMEIKAKGLKRYEQAEKPRKKVERERKVDQDKKEIIDELVACINRNIGKVLEVKTETEIKMVYNETEYTVKLIKHRPKKQSAKGTLFFYNFFQVRRQPLICRAASGTNFTKHPAFQLFLCEKQLKKFFIFFHKMLDF